MYKYIKVLFDLIFAITLSIVASPIILVVIVLLYIHFDGKPFFKQKRLGYKNKEFFIYKFKTMKDLFDEKGNPLPDSQRTTKIGLFIRKLSLDELAQIVNVFKMEMSFIGPRPLSVRNLPYYSQRELLRHEVRPGITGLAQVNGRNHLNWDDRLKYDVEYFEKMSLFLDFKIFLKTIKKCFDKKGHINHSTDPIIDKNKI